MSFLADIVSLDTELTWAQSNYTLYFYKNVFFFGQAEYSYFSADFRFKIFLYYS